MQRIRDLIEWIAIAIELVGVVVIAGSIFLALTPRGLLLRSRPESDAVSAYKQRMGKGLLLGLELLVAADIIGTVGLELTIESLLALGLLVLIRSFLSWSLEVEIEGCWPWRAREERSEHWRAAREGGAAAKSLDVR